jgi:hypothetical protein
VKRDALLDIAMEARKLGALTERLLRENGVGTPLQLVLTDGSDVTRLGAVARRALAAQDRRARLFPADLFADSGWTMLLELYVAQCEGRELRIADLGGPDAGAERRVRALEQHALVERDMGSDGECVALSASGAARMARFFNEEALETARPVPFASGDAGWQPR